MLITLPGPGSYVPPAIEVAVLPSAVKPEADPATTSALPVMKEARARADRGGSIGA
jgi:hypothetical protein